jgi:hypothetical protein
MNIDKSNSPVLVTGIERSGASLIARIIAMCGAFTGTTTNMCENIRIKQYVDEYYAQLGVDPRGQWPLPNIQEMIIPTTWKDDVQHCLNMEYYKQSQLWMYKSPRIGQIWPVWNQAYPKAKWILVRRRTGDVLQSCMKTDFMDAYGDKTIQQMVGAGTERDGWLWWVHEHEKLFLQMMEAELNLKVIWPERMLYGNFEQIHEMLDWLGLQWNPGIIQLLETLLLKNIKQ